MTVLRRQGADAVRRGRPWSLPLEDRALLVAAYWRTNLTMSQLAPLFGVSKSAADRIIDHLGPMLALQPRKRFAKDTVLIVDGTLVPPATTPSPSGRRTTATPPTTRSSSTPTPAWSSWSAGHLPETATTAGRGRSPAPRRLSATH
ncbi:helix-turn-helix domain-containing protein [Streptomyces sp. NBC_00239]|uniref:helix-turn-helix domain-containing protein n=1 Tax=Streptomyces sp. NBC_00239 TaxID=2903640 RepID=UPI002E2B5946|nr:transposase family protein [Streptomyces sp. NBC_00239]